MTLLRSIEEHLAEALPPGAAEAQVLSVLERVGVPGGLLLPVMLLLPLLGESCSESSGPGLPTIKHCTGGHPAGVEVLLVALLVALVIAPIASAAFLARRSRPLVGQ